jgi:hypothetical protein
LKNQFVRGKAEKILYLNRYVVVGIYSGGVNHPLHGLPDCMSEPALCSAGGIIIFDVIPWYEYERQKKTEFRQPGA